LDLPEFDAKADTATDSVATGDKFPFGDVSADGWDTITAENLLAALVAVHPDAGGDDTLFLNGSGGFTAPAGGGCHAPQSQRPSAASTTAPSSAHAITRRVAAPCMDLSCVLVLMCDLCGSSGRPG
jgi:hypothetical protein